MTQQTQKSNGIADDAIEMRHLRDIAAASAANDFLIGAEVDGVWQWIRSTIADIKVLLGIEPGTYAEIFVADGSTNQSIPAGTTYTKCTLFTTDGAESGCTADAANDKITITKAGKYRVSGSFSMKGGTNNVEFKGALFYDNTEQSNIHWERKIGTAGDVGNASFSGIFTSAANKDVDVRIRHLDAGAVDFMLTYANLTVSYLGE